MPYRPQRGMHYQELDTPALLLDLDAFQQNVVLMAQFFDDKPASLRPHSKTHKCPEIALRQLEAGAIGITCAKAGEAEVMAQAGVPDILIANEVVGSIKIDRLTDLAQECDLMVAVDDANNVDELSRACRAKGVSLRVLVDVDIGMRRCGVQPGADALSLAQHVADAPNLCFTGLMGYEGHLMMIADREEKTLKVRKAAAHLDQTVALLQRHGLSVRIVSGGGTGTYDITGVCPAVTEVQAGSYVFMDSSYAKIRPEFVPSLTVLSTVVSRPAADRVVTDAGMKAMTKEFGLPQPLGVRGAAVRSLSEEHGIIQLADPATIDLRPGDNVRFIPSHCCTTANLYDNLHVVQNDVLQDIWSIAARGRAQ